MLTRRLQRFRGVYIQKRCFFPGFSQIVSVISNPVDIIRQLDESRKLLESTREELQASYERLTIPQTETFSPLPGFFPRKVELASLRSCLESQPAFTVLFGGSSTGKTALLRQVLSKPDQFLLVSFDLRLPGFSNIQGMYMSFSMKFEELFNRIINSYADHPNSKVKDAFQSTLKGHINGFKLARRDLEKRIDQALSVTGNSDSVITENNLAQLFEQYQSALLAYWNVDPFKDAEPQDHEKSTNLEHKERKEDEKTPAKSLRNANGTESFRRKIPVLFIDEAHRLGTFISSPDCINILLTASLTLTKQDRLCHVVHATSDPFYMYWLRNLNVSHHVKLLTIDDCTKDETRDYFYEYLLPSTLEKLPSPGLIKHKLFPFDVLWDTFGGRLVFYADYISEFIDTNGNAHPLQSSHFLQAYILLKIYLGDSKFKIQSEYQLPQYSEIDNKDTVSPSVLREVIEEILNNPQNITQNRSVNEINYFAACERWSTAEIHKIVAAKILNLTWITPLSERPPNHNSKNFVFRMPALRPMSRVMFKAMQNIYSNDAAKT
ncbi:hypothetical protein CANCADRAFT_81680 [Tortispora caseinolytica NRRL Y-17796]|uniref:ATPase domain-containing protein n=1 Tax=Tortispora caseinolytica NRRL Y-17796 TaxID=767744 RepID=A0A1E4TJX5_9ASCO|nr:hypothetical protein CANCADRAFT_81680 [Tortispora caseinolytica NRRL Y-17796]